MWVYNSFLLPYLNDDTRCITLSYAATTQRATRFLVVLALSQDLAMLPLPLTLQEATFELRRRQAQMISIIIWALLGMLFFFVRLCNKCIHFLIACNYCTTTRWLLKTHPHATTARMGQDDNRLPTVFWHSHKTWPCHYLLQHSRKPRHVENRPKRFPSSFEPRYIVFFCSTL